jgi:hypothetical protein
VRNTAFAAKARWVYGAVFLASTILALTLEQPSLASDRGVFVSMASALGQGLAPYGEVFDHKDPLTYALGAAFMLLLGGAGWFVADAVLVGSACVCVCAIARALRLTTVQQLLVVVAFGVVLLRAPALAGMAQTAGIAVLCAICLCCVLRQPALCGALLGALVLARLSLVPIGLGVFAIALVGATPRGRLRAVIAASAVTVLGFLTLVALGAFPGYVGMIELNLGYRAKVAQVVGNPDSPVSTFLTLQRGWLDASSLPLLIAAGVGLVVVAVQVAVQRGSLRGLARRQPALPVAGVVAVLGLAVLSATYVWEHHLQFMALPLALLIAAGLAPNRVLSRFAALRYGYLLLVVVAIGAYALALGSPYPRLEPSVNRLAWQSLDDSPTQRLVRTAVAERGAAEGLRLAVIGENNELGVLEALSDDALLACRSFYQFPWMTHQLLEETAACVASDANAVLLHPAAGVCLMDAACVAFRRSVAAELASDYVLRTADRDSGWELWVRR